MIVEVSQLSSYMHNLFLSWSFAMIKFLKSSLFIIDSPYNSVEEITIVICALIIVFLIFWLVLLKTNTNNRQKSNLDIQIKLKEQIDFDSMLGVYNREAFYRFTEKLLIDNPKMDFSIVCFDIYRFKLYNDLFGVSAGDELLKKVAKVIKDSIPKNATYGKFYADHFIACIPSKAMDFDALDKQINKVIKNEKYGFDIKLKFGIYKIEDKTISVDKMSKWANMALDKINDKKDVNVVYFDEELKNRIQDEKDIMTDFEQAIKMHQFLVYLQPIYSISRDAIVGAEALVRWNHPSKGLLLPGKFISILEKNDIITELDYYVWEEVCKFIQKRKKEGKEDLSISVNVSRLELYDPNFVSNIKQLLDKYDVTPQQFKLEITETLYAESPEQFLGSIAELQKMGFQVLMDDFGSGYSSLNVLRDLPVDAIKIDLRFLE
ncbi:MAG: EAL domain-containing protein, partial [Bacilli bacterium]